MHVKCVLVSVSSSWIYVDGVWQHSNPWPEKYRKNKTPHTFKERIGRGGRVKGETRKVHERGHLFLFRTLSNCSQTYFLPGLSCLKETVFPVAAAKGFGVGHFAANTHMCCWDSGPGLSVPAWGERSPSHCSRVAGALNYGSACGEHGSRLPCERCSEGLAFP